MDGNIHEQQQEQDQHREQILTELGCRILRFQNEEIFHDLATVLKKIRSAFKK